MKYSIILLAMVIIAEASSQTNLNSSVAGNSSATTGSVNLRINSTVGQPIIGQSASANYRVNSGFWYTLQSLEAPTLSNPLAYEVNDNSTSFSIEASANGSSSTIGFEYGTVTEVYTATFSTLEGDNLNNDPVATGSATVSGNITGLTPETTYFIRAFGENSTGSSTSTEISFTTLSPEPLSHSSFAQINEGLSSITFTHDRADDNSIQAEGYLILRKTTSFNSDDYPQDGNVYAVDDPIGNAIVVANITDVSSTQTIVSELPKEKSWQFALVPYNTSNNDASLNYLNTNAPTVSGYTIPTLGEWGMIAFGGLMLFFGINRIRKIV
jgi:hypothetical protein